MLTDYYIKIIFSDKMGIFSLPVLALVAIVGVAIKAVLYFLAKSPSENPFKQPIRTPVKPKVTDQKNRDAVLKQGVLRSKWCFLLELF